MRSAPATSDELQRLEVLRQLQLLDSGPEAVFDTLTTLAANLLDVPIALVSLVDQSRQWFKSRVGLEASETPREIAFCAHTILDTTPMVVPDATRDERFSDNPLVLGDPRIRAYAGVPLRTGDGRALGTLCAMDRRPREFSDGEIATLQRLAGLVEREIRHRESTLRALAMVEANFQRERAREAEYRRIFESAALGIALVSVDGRWLKVNARYCEMLGRREEELAHLGFRDITHPEDLPGDVEMRDRLLAGGATRITREKRYLRPDGQVVWVSLEASVNRDEAGRPQGLVLVAQDISARREAERQVRELRHELEERVEERTRELRDANRHLADSILQQRRSEAALATREAELAAIVDGQTEVVCRMDGKGRILFANRACRELFGLRDDDLATSRWQGVVWPEDLPRVLEALRAMSPGQPTVVTEHRIQAHGELRWVEFVNRGFHDASGQLEEVQSVGRDITDRKRLEQALVTANRLQQLMLDNDLVGMVRLRERRVEWHNRAFARMFGYGEESLRGRSSREIYADDETWQRVGSEAYPVLRDGGTWRGQVAMRHQSGAPLWVDISGSPLSAETGETLWMMLDLTRMKERHDEVASLALHDPLTKLPNRVLMLDRLALSLASAHRSRRSVAVCFIDLDGFKAVNDTLGHEAGDELLVAVAARLGACVRSNDTVARLGGDEFVLVLADLNDADECQLVINRATTALSEPVVLGGGRVARVTGSAGVSFYPRDGVDAPTLLAIADRRMYAAKRAAPPSPGPV